MAPITAIKQDKELAAIRSKTRAKKDEVPFLLFPVRVETRFMQVARSTKTGGVHVSTTLKAIVEAQKVYLTPIKGVTFAKAQLITKQGITAIAKLHTGQLKNIRGITPMERSWVRNEVNDLLEKGKKFYSELSTKRFKPTQLRALGQLSKKFQSNLKKLSNVVKGLEATQDVTHVEASGLIDEMRLLERRARTIAGKDLPNTSRGKKHKLVTFVSSALKAFENFYERDLDYYKTVTAMESTQLKRIEELHENMVRAIKRTPANLRRVHGDPKWKVYVEKVGKTQVNPMKGGFEQFDGQILGKFKQLADLQTVSGTKLFYDSLRTWKALHEFNVLKTDSFSSIKKQKTNILNRLKKNALVGQHVIKTDEEEALQLEKLWAAIDKEVKTFTKKLSRFTVTNPSHRFSLKSGITQATTISKEKLKIFRDISGGAFKSVSSEILATSAANFTKTTNKLDTINAQLKKLKSGTGRVTEKQKIGLLEDIKTVSLTLKNAKNTNFFLPEKNRKELDAKAKKMATGLKGVKTIKTKQGAFDTATLGKNLTRLLADKKLTTVTGANSLNEEFKTKGIFIANKKLMNELWVRIYPDDIAIHTHEEALTELEITTGKDYWKEIWIASGDRDMELGAWRVLCEFNGSERAAYIAKFLDPSNVSVANKKKFDLKPDQGLIDCKKQLSAAVENMRKVSNLDTAVRVRRKLLGNTILKNLKEANTAIKNEAIAHEYAYNKVVNEIRRVQGRFTIIVNILNRSSGSVVNELQATFNTIFTEFNVLQEKMASFKVLTGLEFSEATALTFTFPNVSQKNDDWTAAPHSKVMPDRFVVILKTEKTYRHIKVGKTLPSTGLKVGLNPEKFDLDNVYKYTSNGDLEVDPDIKWLTDYSAAEQVGMGITVTLSASEFANGFDQVFVLGVNNGTASQSKQQLEKLLNNHHYTPGGMELLPLGTPTNNTEGSKAAYSSTVTDFDTTYDLEMGENNFAENVIGGQISADGKLLCEALGISYDILQHIKGSGKKEMELPKLMNRALFPATMGYYMDEMMDNLFKEEDTESTSNFMINHVSARGHLPSIRVDSQPYGVLLTTAFTKFEHQTGNNYKEKLQETLKVFHKEWSKIREEHVVHAYNVVNNSQAHFLEILGLQPASIEYYTRFAANTFLTFPTDEFPAQETVSTASLMNIFGHLIPSETVETDEVSQQHAYWEKFLKLDLSKNFSAISFAENSQYTGIRVQEGELSTTEPLEGGNQNYIKWLLEHNLFDVLGSNNIEEFPSKSLLYLMLRQSMLWTYAQASLDILRREHFISFFDKFRIGGTGFMEIPTSDHNPDGLDKKITKWSFLFRSLNRLDGGEEHFTDGGFKKKDSRFLYNHLVKGSGNENNEAWTMAKYLNPIDKSLFNSFSGHNGHNASLSPASQLRSAFNKISELPSVVLDQLLAEHLDLCSYRLDSWLIGLAHERLRKQRDATKEGIHLGCYGYLEDLRPGGARTRVDPDVVPESLKSGTDPIFTDEDNQGHIHMPSINHAITAAILRAGYKSNEDEDGDIENQMAVNLSSARVRMALQLIEGVKNGQEIAAVLGYQLERGLHERYEDAEMDRFIYPLRRKFPLRPDIQLVANDGNYNPHVIHGNDLLDLIDDHIKDMSFPSNQSLFEVLYNGGTFSRTPQVFKDIITKNGGKNKHLKILLQEIDRIADAFDALGDLALSECVYQIAQGNHVRAGSMLEALAQGKNMPDPQIVTTPRTGTVVTQRVVWALETVAAPVAPNAAASKPVGWSSKLTPRALAEPSLNKMLGNLFGPATNIRCLVRFNQNDTAESIEVNMAELSLHPTDLLAGLETGRDGSNAFNKRIAFLVRAKATPKLAVDVPLDISIKDRDPGWGDEIRTLYELMPLIGQLQKLLGDVRPAHADDLRIPLESVEPLSVMRHQDVAELDLRRKAAESLFFGVRDDIDAFFASQINSEQLDTATFNTTQINNMRAMLFSLNDLGVPDTVPDAVIELTDEIGRDLARQLIVARSTITKKENAIEKLQSAYTAEKNEDNKCGHLIGILRQIFGRSFTVLPLFKLQNRTEIKNILQIDEADGLLRHNPLAMEDWLQGIGRVREKLYALEMAGMLSEVWEHEFPQAEPVQLPYRSASPDLPADYWLGVEYPKSYIPDDDKLSLVVLNGDALIDTTKSKAVLILDEWLEIIPNEEETTGLTFNYDQPDAAPPQSVLLAVTPKVTGNWDWDNLIYTLEDTIALAKNRAVEPDHIENSVFAKVLPAISSELLAPNVELPLEPKTQVPLDYLALNKQETP